MGNFTLGEGTNMIVSSRHLGEYFLESIEYMRPQGDLLDAFRGAGENWDPTKGRFLPSSRRGYYHSRYSLERNAVPIRQMLEEDLAAAKPFFEELAGAVVDEIRLRHADVTARVVRDRDGRLEGCRLNKKQINPSRGIAVMTADLAAVSFSSAVWKVMSDRPDLVRMMEGLISDPVAKSLYAMPDDPSAKALLPSMLLHHMCTDARYEGHFMDIRLASSFLDLDQIYKSMSKSLSGRSGMATSPGITVAAVAARYGIPMPNRSILSLPAYLTLLHTRKYRWEDVDGNFGGLASRVMNVAGQYAIFLDAVTRSPGADLDGERSTLGTTRLFNDGGDGVEYHYDIEIYRRARAALEALEGGTRRENRLARLLTSPSFVSLPEQNSSSANVPPETYYSTGMRHPQASMAASIFTLAMDHYSKKGLSWQRSFLEEPRSNPEPEFIRFGGLAADGFSEFLELPASRSSRVLNNLYYPDSAKSSPYRLLFAVCSDLWRKRDRWLGSEVPVLHLRDEEVVRGSTPLFPLILSSTFSVPYMMDRDEWNRYMDLGDRYQRWLFMGIGNHLSMPVEPVMRQGNPKRLNADLFRKHLRKDDYLVRFDFDRWLSVRGGGGFLARSPDAADLAPMSIMSDPEIFRAGCPSGPPYDEGTLDEIALTTWLHNKPDRMTRSNNGRNEVEKTALDVYIEEHGRHIFLDIADNLIKDPPEMSHRGAESLRKALSNFLYFAYCEGWDQDIPSLVPLDKSSASPHLLRLYLVSEENSGLLLGDLAKCPTRLRLVDSLGTMIERFMPDNYRQAGQSLWISLAACHILLVPELWGEYTSSERKDRKGGKFTLTLGEMAAEILVARMLYVTLCMKRGAYGSSSNKFKDLMAQFQSRLVHALLQVPDETTAKVMRRFFGTARRKESSGILMPDLSTRIAVCSALNDPDMTEAMDSMDSMGL